MGFQQAQKLYKQTESLIKNKIYLKNRNCENGEIDFDAELEDLGVYSTKIQKLTFDLLKRNQKNPALATWVIELYILSEYYLEELYKLNKERPTQKCKDTCLKYYYFFKCQHYLYKYKRFLRQQIFGQNFIQERILQSPSQYYSPSDQGVKKPQASTDLLPNKKGNKIQLPAGYIKKDPNKVSIPKAMALLEYLGVRNHPKFLALPHEKQIGIYQMILGGAFRTVEGNNSVLDDFSNDNRDRFTSHKHKKWAEKQFQTTM